MSILNWLGGRSIAEPIDAIGNAVDKIFTSDDERMEAQAVINRIRMQPNILNAELNKVEAQHRSIFVAGWRPAVGWLCALGIGFAFIGNPLLQRFVGGEPVAVPLDMILELVLAMLGMAGLRTVEKLRGSTK
jgi:hypothetical protein